MAFTGNLAEMRSHTPVVRQKAVKAKRKPMRAISKKHSAKLKEYAKLRAQFLKDHPYCQWWMLKNLVEATHSQLTLDECEALAQCGPHPIPRSTEIHHKKGRGKYLLDVSTWMAVSRTGHDWIHAHPKEAYEKGYMLPRR